MKGWCQALISFENFSMKDTSPIYLQIVLYIKKAIVAGAVNNGDELPSRRFLSTLLGVNPNTVQKAYRILEEENLIQSHTGAKSLVVLTDIKRKEIREELLENDAKSIVSALKEMGISKDEAVTLITKLWKDGD